MPRAYNLASEASHEGKARVKKKYDISENGGTRDGKGSREAW
jgi:hypothetical protein